MILLNIMGGVCILLWGLRSVKNGMIRAFGADLHTIIAKATSNRMAAFLSGIGVTALLQSSTATALIIASFCKQGILTVTAGLAVMLGADVGTAVVAQVLSFDLSWLAPLLFILGYVVFTLYRKKGKLEHIGKFMIGLALMLFALSWIKQAAAPLNSSDVLPVIIKSLERDPLMALFIAASMTWLTYSSLAVILLFTSLAISGVLPPGLGLVMVLGANIGGAFIPVLATMRGSREGLRVPFGNLIMRIITALLIFPFLDLISDLLLMYGSSSSRLLVDFHMAFNLGLALIFLPLISLVAMICNKLIKVPDKSEDPSAPLYLEEKELDTPSVALAAAMRETLRMADILEDMMDDSLKALRDNDHILAREVQKKDDLLDDIYRAVKMYMAKITTESLDPDESFKYMLILGFALNIENAGDTIDKSMMDMAMKKSKLRRNFSKQGWKEIEGIHNYVHETVRLAHNLFVSSDPSLARRMLKRKDELREKEQAAMQSHMERIAEGVPETIATSSFHLDIIRDYRRVNGYLSSVAYPILDEVGELRPNRLKKSKKES